jgi:hypothetical protein
MIEMPEAMLVLFEIITQRKRLYYEHLFVILFIRFWNKYFKSKANN